MNAVTPEKVRAVLDLKTGSGDSDETVRGYLVKLLETLWRKEAEFSGKRPFGSSGWQADLYLPLVKAGMVPGEVDEDGYLDRVDEGEADALILAAVAELGAVHDVDAAIDARVAAMVHAADGGTVVVAFREPLDPDEIDDHHERWAKYVPGGVTLVIADGVAAAEAGDLADDFLFERKQVVELRAVLGEIFACLKAGDPSLLDNEQVAEWRERTGMEDL